MQRDPALDVAIEHATAFLSGLAGRPAGAVATVAEIRAALGGPLPAAGEAAATVVTRLAEGADPGLVATPGPRYFGYVMGGSLPAALAADWLAVAWDQVAGLAVMSPAAAAVEEVAGAWLIDLLGLPSDASFGFVTGAQMANFTALAAARHRVLADVGWDVERDGLQGAPKVRTVMGAESHATIPLALRMLGLGGSPALVEADEQGRMRPDALRAVLAAGDGPAIVCAQAGNVNTGSFDPLGRIAQICDEHGAWLHVDGAFGLWAAASPRLRGLLEGHGKARSWATDGHKWLNVPYDCGVVFCADPAAHRAAMSWEAAYVLPSDQREPFQYVPEASRRARAFAVWAALRQLGRDGVAEMIERGCANARHAARRLDAANGVEVLNDVVLNQVLVRFDDSDAFTEAVIGRVQAEGTCWLGGTVWQGKAAMRFSASNWSTTTADVDRSVDAILACAAG